MSRPVPLTAQLMATLTLLAWGLVPGGVASGSVFCQRSHIRQRQGHSRLVRKIVAIDAGWPASSDSSSNRKAAATFGSRRFRLPRRSRIHRSRFGPWGESR